MDDLSYKAPDSRTRQNDGPDISGEIRGIPVITAAMLLSACFVRGVGLVHNDGELGTQPNIGAFVGIVFAAIVFVAHLIVPAVIRRQQLSLLSPQQIRNVDQQTRFTLLRPTYRSTHVITIALLEGAAICNLTFYILSPYAGSLVVAAFLILCITARFPTDKSVADMGANSC